jgi:hypothetical protein
MSARQPATLRKGLSHRFCRRGRPHGRKLSGHEDKHTVHDPTDNRNGIPVRRFSRWRAVSVRNDIGRGFVAPHPGHELDCRAQKVIISPVASQAQIETMLSVGVMGCV